MASPLNRRLRRHGDEGGQALVEFAIAAMLFFMLVFGIFDFSRMLQAWITVEHSSREAARYAVTGRTDCTGITGDREACIISVAKRSTSGLAGGGDSGSRVTVSYSSGRYPTYTPMVPGDAGQQCDAIDVRVTYSFEFATPFLKPFAPGGMSLSGDQRMVAEPYGPCN